MIDLEVKPKSSEEFLTTGKITQQFQQTDAFVTRAKLEFEVEDKVFTFDFATDDDKNISD